jgi:hypothetical protein
MFPAILRRLFENDGAGPLLKNVMPRAKMGSGVGQLYPIIGNSSSSLYTPPYYIKIPSGGTWVYWFCALDMFDSGTVEPMQETGMVAGGTQISTGIRGKIFGWCWRIS